MLVLSIDLTHGYWSTMCGGDFLSKNPEEALDFLSYVIEASKGWNEHNPMEMERMRPQPSTRGGMYCKTREIPIYGKRAKS